MGFITIKQPPCGREYVVIFFQPPNKQMKGVYFCCLFQTFGGKRSYLIFSVVFSNGGWQETTNYMVLINDQ